MSGSGSPVIGHRASRHLIHPRSEPLRIPQPDNARLDPEIDVLQNIIEIVRVRQAPSDERPEVPFDLLPGAASTRLNQDVLLLSLRSSSARSMTGSSA